MYRLQKKTIIDGVNTRLLKDYFDPQGFDTYEDIISCEFVYEPVVDTISFPVDMCSLVDPDDAIYHTAIGWSNNGTVCIRYHPYKCDQAVCFGETDICSPSTNQCDVACYDLTTTASSTQKLVLHSQYQDIAGSGFEKDMVWIEFQFFAQNETPPTNPPTASPVSPPPPPPVLIMRVVAEVRHQL
mmetsp:Transcript_18137/g.31220  ORF Transcript_18137/g.31220 Transcript_18137/m.31220 type:complete len:185 (-) Transcript_18137:694-1248(-)